MEFECEVNTEQKERGKNFNNELRFTNGKKKHVNFSVENKSFLYFISTFVRFSIPMNY